MWDKIKGKIIGNLTFALGLDNYKNIQKLYIALNKLDATFNTIPAWLSNIAALSVPIIIFLTTKDPAKTVATPLVVIIIYLLIIGCLKLIVSHVIKNTGIHGDFVLPGKYFIKNVDTAGCEINLNDIDEGRFEFATEITAMDSAIINFEAYDYGAWATSIDDKFKRNLSHIQKNPFCILLIKCKEKKNYIGFSHCIPIGKMVWDDYMKGNISDNTFSSDHILACDSDASKCYGIINFSLGLRKANINYDVPTNKYEIGDLIEQASSYHMSIIREMFKKGEKIPVVLQNFSITYHRYFKDCATIEGGTKEGGRMIKFYLSNT